MSFLATAVMHTVGIAVISTALSNDGHMQIVMPFLNGPEPVKVASQKATSIHDVEDGIEQHTAAILYRRADRRSISGWTESPVPSSDPNAANDYAWVKLDHERITVVPLVLQKAATKKQSTRPASAGSHDMLGIPHIKAPNLKAAFREPFPGAVAVFDLPSGTTGSGCLYGYRVDTRLSLQNGGTITLRDASGRSLVLDGGAVFFVANVPTSLFTGHSMPGTMEHVMAYALMSTSGGDLTGLPALDNCKLPPLRPIGAIPKNRPHDAQNWQAGTDFQCSNSQWP